MDAKPAKKVFYINYSNYYSIKNIYKNLKQ